MKIVVTNVGEVTTASKGSRSWNERVIAYTGQKGDATKTLRKFDGQEQIWNDFANIPSGATVDVEVKKEGDFWNWKSAKVVPADVSNTQASKATSAAPGKAKREGDWETAAERAQKQIYIVRQSSIDYALKYFGLRNEVPSLTQVLEVAATFERHVLNKDVASERPLTPPATQAPVAAARPRGRPRRTVEVEVEDGEVEVE